MQQQASDPPHSQAPPTSSVASDDTPPPSSGRQLSASLPVLRFPKPQGSQQLANWISSSFPHIMQPSNVSDESSLTDYEVIHATDNESQDSPLTESIGSLAASRPDDVQSLEGSENHYGSDSDNESDDSSRASSIRYADQALQNPSTQLPTSSLEHGSATEGSGVVVGSIEFQEGDRDSHGPAPYEKISVKHVVREFSEEESLALGQHLFPPEPPRRLVATIRQTMSQGYLSTREPLRLLYVGRSDAQRDIVLKICNAIWVSTKDGAQDQGHFGRYREGLYNIVPISWWGPNPELDLMEASRCQIKVEHCTSAEVVSERGLFLDDAVYSATIEQEKVYRSFFSPSGFAVQPKWDLPHVAVIYCSEQDDAEAKRTRVAAWSFMHRHGVPSIFISDHQYFSDHSAGSWGDYIDEHAVHLCLESRDPDRPALPQRFPIDYASFADIDARQMNRNLAYLTGLYEPEENNAEVGVASSLEMPELEPQVLKALSTAKLASAKFIERHNLKWWTVALVVPVLMSIVTPFAFGVFAGWFRPRDASHPESPLSTGVCRSPQSHRGDFTTSSASSVATSTTTVVINVTSTKTVRVSQEQPSTSTLASALSFAGLLSDRPSAVPVEPEAKRPSSPQKKALCSVRVYSPTEFLVAIPSRNKAMWLAQGAIDIDVYRGDDRLKTKISSVDEGVLVELGSSDAYGVLNVSVVTSRKPKINETFQIDFGKATVVEALEAGLQLLQEGLKKVSSSIDDASHLLEDMFSLPEAGLQLLQEGLKKVSSSTGDASHLLEDMFALPDELLSFLERASETARRRAIGTANWAANDVRERIARDLQAAETLRQGVELSILQAQITSKLWWLKVQGKTDEYAAYKRNASRLLKMKHAEFLKGQGTQGKGSPKGGWKFFGKRRGSLWPCKGDCPRDTRETPARDGGWDMRWKKMIMGGD